MSRISSREAVVLGLLCEGFRYGYELEEVIEERGMRVWTEIGFSSIYYVLKRLEEAKLIESTLKHVEKRPSRRVYTVTEKGYNTMKEKVKSVLSKNQKLISPLDLGIAYHHLLDSEEVVECLRLYLTSLEERKATLEDSIHKKEGEGAPYSVIALFSRPLAHVEAEKRWVEQFAEEMERRILHENND